MTWKRELGRQIKEARRSVKLTQQELADKVGVSRQMVSRYEGGRDAPGVETLAAIARLSEAKFEILGCRIAFESGDAQFKLRAVPKQFELPFKKSRKFPRAIVEITPMSGRILIKADIPA